MQNIFQKILLIAGLIVITSWLTRISFAAEPGKNIRQDQSQTEQPVQVSNPGSRSGTRSTNRPAVTGNYKTPATTTSHAPKVKKGGKGNWTEMNTEQSMTGSKPTESENPLKNKLQQ